MIGLETIEPSNVNVILNMNLSIYHFIFHSKWSLSPTLYVIEETVRLQCYELTVTDIE